MVLRRRDMSAWLGGGVGVDVTLRVQLYNAVIYGV